jgi:hypothetical protein
LESQLCNDCALMWSRLQQYIAVSLWVNRDVGSQSLDSWKRISMIDVISIPSEFGIKGSAQLFWIPQSCTFLSEWCQMNLRFWVIRTTGNDCAFNMNVGNRKQTWWKSGFPGCWQEILTP